MKPLIGVVLFSAFAIPLFFSTVHLSAAAGTAGDAIREYQERLEAAETPEQREAVVAEMRKAALRERAALEEIQVRLNELTRKINATAAGEERDALIAEYHSTSMGRFESGSLHAWLSRESGLSRVLTPEERAEQEERRRERLAGMEIRRELNRELRALPHEERVRILRESRQNPDRAAALLEELRAKREAREAVGELGEMPENPLDRWIFSSFITLAGEPLFSMHNPWENETFWAVAGERHHGIEIGSFDASANTLTLRSGDQTRVVGLGGSAKRQTAPVGGGRPAPDPALVRLEEIWKEALPQSETLRETDRELREFSRAYGRTRSELHTWHRETLPSEERRTRIESRIEEMNAMVRKSRELAKSAALRAMENPHFADENEETVRRFFSNRISTAAGREMMGILHPETLPPPPP